jgi:hypothetical protein
MADCDGGAEHSTQAGTAQGARGALHPLGHKAWFPHPPTPAPAAIGAAHSLYPLLLWCAVRRSTAGPEGRVTYRTFGGQETELCIIWGHAKTNAEQKQHIAKSDC